MGSHPGVYLGTFIMQYLIDRKEDNMNRYNRVSSLIIDTMKPFLSMLFGLLISQVSPDLAIS